MPLICIDYINIFLLCILIICHLFRIINFNLIKKFIGESKSDKL